MSEKILVSGLINIETTLRIASFPIPYEPVHYPFFGINSTVSGVGFNVAAALTTLGNRIEFLSLTGRDFAGELVARTLAVRGMPSSRVLQEMLQTAQSLILYDGEGRRQIYTDLKDIQDRAYPRAGFEEALAGCQAAILCNINYNRPYLEFARRAGVLVATDVHTIAGVEDAYNSDFMAAATVLFLSDEKLPEPAEHFARRLQDRYGNEVVVIGLGREGALLAVKRDNFVGRFRAAHTRPVVNTIGAGDALFSAFIHTYCRTKDPYLALRKATVFASYKIGAVGAAEGFLNDTELDALVQDLGSADSA